MEQCSSISFSLAFWSRKWTAVRTVSARSTGLREKEAGSAAKWSERDLLGVLIGAGAGAGVIALWVADLSYPVRIAGTLAGVVVITLGYLYPVRGYLARSGTPPEERRRTIGRMLLAAGLSGVPLLATWGGVMWQYNFVDDLTKGTADHAFAGSSSPRARGCSCSRSPAPGATREARWARGSPACG